MQRGNIKKWIVRWGIIPLFFFPFSVILLFKVFQKPEWVGRLIALSVVLIIAIPALFWYALSPKTKMIYKGALLDKPGYEKAKNVADRIARLIFIGLALGFLFYIMVPLSRDIYLVMHGEKPAVIQGRVTYNSTPRGVWFMSQSIRLHEETDDNYFLIFSIEPPLQLQNKYEFFVLRNSRLILEVRKINE